QPVTVRARVSDQTGVANVGVSLGSPIDTPALTATLARVSGDQLDGVYEATLTVPELSGLGSWPASITVSDGPGNHQTLDSAALTQAGLDSALQVNGTSSAPPAGVMAYTSYNPLFGGSGDLYMLASTGGPQRLTNGRHLTAPQLSPDGTRVAAM